MSVLCYADGVHLTEGWRVTLCGRPVVDVPLVPRTVEPLTCAECYRLDHVTQVDVTTPETKGSC